MPIGFSQVVPNFLTVILATSSCQCLFVVIENSERIQFFNRTYYSLGVLGTENLGIITLYLNLYDTCLPGDTIIIGVHLPSLSIHTVAKMSCCCYWHSWVLYLDPNKIARNKA